MTQLLLKLWKRLDLSKELQLKIIRLFQDKFLVGVTGLIFDEKDRILLFKHTYRQIPWGLPGGFLKAKEHPILGLEREIEEESGLIIAIDERLKIKIDKDVSSLDICYLGTFIGGEFTTSSEVSEYGLFPVNSLPLLPKAQLILIDQAAEQRQFQRHNHYLAS